MKKVFAVLACAVFGFMSFPGPAFAEGKIIVGYEIPERYVLLKVLGFNPEDDLSGEGIIELMKEKLDQYGVKTLQYVIYDEGMKEGQGVRAYGEVTKSKDAKVVPFAEFKGDDKHSLKAKIVENVLGCNISPKELYDAYSDNEVVADDDFKGKPVILKVKVPQVSKDPFGKPYIKVPVDKHGLFGLHIYIDKKDPFLRKIKKGSQIIVRGYPKGFIMQSVTLDGIIVSDGESVLVDGKSVSLEEIKKK